MRKMRKMIAVIFLVVFSSIANAQEYCTYKELMRIEQEIISLQKELGEGIDYTPCKLFYLFGEFAEKKAPESGFGELYKRLGRIVCQDIENEYFAKMRRLEMLKEFKDKCRWSLQGY